MEGRNQKYHSGSHKYYNIIYNLERGCCRRGTTCEAGKKNSWLWQYSIIIRVDPCSMWLKAVSLSVAVFTCFGAKKVKPYGVHIAWTHMRFCRHIGAWLENWCKARQLVTLSTLTFGPLVLMNVHSAAREDHASSFVYISLHTYIKLLNTFKKFSQC